MTNALCPTYPPPMPSASQPEPLSRHARVLARAERCQLRMMRGAVAAEMREFHRLQRGRDRAHRQRHPTKETRALRSLIHELAYVGTHSHGSGTHSA